MEEVLCARALKSANGPAEPPHTIWPVVFSGERALKGAGERNTRNQVGAGTSGKPPARGGVERLCVVRKRRIGGGGFISPAGKLLAGNIGSLCEQQPLKALRAPGGPIPQYKMLYYFGETPVLLARVVCQQLIS
jgi:hypothetical protein